MAYSRPEWVQKNWTKLVFDLFEKLMAEKSATTWVDFHSSNYFYSGYIIPKNKKLCYGAHPDGTIRISNHWSFYSSEKKCADLSAIQCHLYGINPFERKEKGAATRPIKRVDIAICYKGVYYSLTTTAYGKQIAKTLKF